MHLFLHLWMLTKSDTVWYTSRLKISFWHCHWHKKYFLNEQTNAETMILGENLLSTAGEISAKPNWPEANLFWGRQAPSWTEPAPAKHFPDLNCSSLSLDITWNKWRGWALHTVDWAAAGLNLCRECNSPLPLLFFPTPICNVAVGTCCLGKIQQKFKFSQC